MQWGNYYHGLFRNPSAAVNLFLVGKQYLTFCTAEAAVTHNLIDRKIISNVKRSDTRNSLRMVASSVVVLPYLDTTISLPTTEDRCFTSKVFSKRTCLILNFSAVRPQKWKFGLIQCLMHRAYTISSSWLTFSQEVHFLKGVFSQNGYPEDLFTSCLRRFVNNKCDKSIQNSKIKEDRVETIFFIPYIVLPSIIFSQKVKELFKKYYCIDTRIVFTSFKVKNYFSLKCRTPLPLLANVVY